MGQLFVYFDLDIYKSPLYENSIFIDFWIPHHLHHCDFHLASISTLSNFHAILYLSMQVSIPNIQKFGYSKHPDSGKHKTPIFTIFQISGFLDSTLLIMFNLTHIHHVGFLQLHDTLACHINKPCQHATCPPCHISMKHHHATSTYHTNTPCQHFRNCKGWDC